MNDVLTQIEQLEDEIRQVSEIEAKLERYIRREKRGEHRAIAEGQLRHVSRRLDVAEAELKALQDSLGTIRRVRRVLERPKPYTPIRITEFKEVPA